MSMGTTGRVRRGHKTEPSDAPRASVDPVVSNVAGTVAEVEHRLAWAQGLDGPEGERLTAASLGILGRFGWASLHAATWPGLPDVQDVHVAIGPGGVVVVAERTWTGHVVVEGGVLRHDGFRCERDIEALHAAMGAVAALLPAEHRDVVTGVIHVTPRDMPPAGIAGVTVVGRLHLATMLVDLPQRLSPLDVADITRWLTRAVEVPVTPLASSGGAAMSTGTVFYPSSPGGSDTAAYFVPRQPAVATVPLTPAAAVPEYDAATWALLYPTNNRFGIR